MVGCGVSGIFKRLSLVAKMLLVLGMSVYVLLLGNVRLVRQRNIRSASGTLGLK